MANVCIIEPYYGGSHRAWLDGLTQHSRHNITALTLPAQFWKWRMQGGAVALANQYQKLSLTPDVIIASDMMDLSIFRVLTRQSTSNIPIGIYFHENQLTYPQGSRQEHGWRYGFINYASALSADRIFFNSQYHLESFFEELLRMLKHFGDTNELHMVEVLRERSSVLPVGVALRRFDRHAEQNKGSNSPLILWNHRWDEDKNPAEFLDSMVELFARGYDFRLALLGRNVRQNPAEFEEARQKLGDRIIQYGSVNRFEEYARLLWQADYVVSTAFQDFFGIAIVEAIYCRCIPILARRLNYPFLLPSKYHSDCLYSDGNLTTLLQLHLEGKLDVDTSNLREAVAQYDWKQMIVRYDMAIDELAKM